MRKLRVGVLGATGMVGQRFITLLDGHPLFHVTAVAASSRSAGRSYQEAVDGRWVMSQEIPQPVRGLTVLAVDALAQVKSEVDFLFSAVDMEKQAILDIENAYAAEDVPVVSNNSAHRWTADVPVLIPEVNPDHLALIETQRRLRKWKRGFVVTKPNCSLQSYVPVLAALSEFGPRQVMVTTFQAISGAGKLLSACPEIQDNVIPLPGEEDKSEREPLKILGRYDGDSIQLNQEIKISAHCQRVPVADGHLAAVSVGFARKPTPQQFLSCLKEWEPEPQKLRLASAPRPFFIYVEGDDRPQTRLDRDAGNGMAITVGRLRPCHVLDYRFMALSHNTIRGAAGGAILTAELLHAKGFFD